MKSAAKAVGINKSTVLSSAFDAWDSISSWTDDVFGSVASKATSTYDSALSAFEGAKKDVSQDGIDRDLHDFFDDLDNVGTTSGTSTVGWNSGGGTISNPGNMGNYGTGAEKDGASGADHGGAQSSSSSPGGMGDDDAGEGGAQYATGGIVNRLMVPSGDDGFAALKFGEGVVKDDTMKILDSQIRSGELGIGKDVVVAIKELAETVTQIGAAIRTDTLRMYKLLNKFEYEGIQVR